MRSLVFKKGALPSWLLGGSLLVGLSAFAGCSSDGGTPSDDDDSGSCTEDTSSDNQNCGSCGNACLSGEACVNGSCSLSCAPAQTECGSVCADTSSNSLHCGGCNQACDTGEICQNGACMTGSCPTGQMPCSGACTDTQTSTVHCGACGHACLATQTCAGGLCTGGSGTGGSGGGGTGGTSGTGGTDATGGTNATGGASGAGTTGGSAGSGTTGGSGGAGGSGNGGSGGAPTTGECRVWLATNGSDTAAGTEAAPVATLAKAYDLMCPMQSGAANGAPCAGPAPRSICIKSGTYPMTERLEFRKTRMGTADNRIIVQGAPGLSLAQRPVFDFATQPRLGCGESDDNIGGFTVNAHFVTIKNLIVRNANDTCIEVQGINGVVENVLVSGCADTGIQISSGDPFTPQAKDNVIRNCDSHSNDDSQCDGENADGFAIKEGTGTGNTFAGCRAWNNADDGFDFFAWTSPVRLENSWAFNQTDTTGGAESDGNGFKLGGSDVSAAHVLSGLYATGNVNGSNGEGFTRNSNPASMSCSNCASWGNTGNGADGITGVSTTAPSGATVAKMTADTARNADGSLKAITGL